MGGGRGQAAQAVECGLGFIRDYYNKYSKAPEELEMMYSDASVYCHHLSSDSPEAIVGRSAIAAQLAEVSVVERKYSISTLEAHPTVNDSVLIIVRGTCLMLRSSEDFVHTFVIARAQGGTYYIHNDCMESTPSPDPDAVDVWADKSHAAEAQEEQAPPPRQKSPGRQQPVAPPPARQKSPAKERSATPPRAVAPPSAAPRRPSPERERAPGALNWAGIVKDTQAAPVQQVVAPQRVAGGRVPVQGQAQAAKVQEDPKAPAKVTADGWNVVAERRRPSPGPQQRRAPSPVRDGPERGRGKSPDPRERRGKSPERGGSRYEHAALYVNNLPPGMSENDIDRIFGQYGRIVGKTFRPGQFCFVDYEDGNAVQCAMEVADTDGIYYKNTLLSVQERKSPQERARERAMGGGGGGRGMRGRDFA